MPKDQQAIIAFHSAALRSILHLLRHYGIHTSEQLNAVNGSKLITESLWKVPEALGVRVPAQADHRFRSKPITDSGRSRSPIPGKPITRWWLTAAR